MRKILFIFLLCCNALFSFTQCQNQIKIFVGIELSPLSFLNAKIGLQYNVTNNFRIGTYLGFGGFLSFYTIGIYGGYEYNTFTTDINLNLTYILPPSASGSSGFIFYINPTIGFISDESDFLGDTDLERLYYKGGPLIVIVSNLLESGKFIIQPPLFINFELGYLYCN